jgi:hypothetical protein
LKSIDLEGKEEMVRPEGVEPPTYWFVAVNNVLPTFALGFPIVSQTGMNTGDSQRFGHPQVALDLPYFPKGVPPKIPPIQVTLGDGAGAAASTASLAHSPTLLKDGLHLALSDGAYQDLVIFLVLVSIGEGERRMARSNTSLFPMYPLSMARFPDLA